MKKTTTTCVWATDTKYLLLTWVGGEYFMVQRWTLQRCGEDTLEGYPDFMTKSQIRDLVMKSRGRYNLTTFAPAEEWLGYTLNKGINPEQARVRLVEGGVL